MGWGGGDDVGQLIIDAGVAGPDYLTVHGADTVNTLDNNNGKVH